MASSKGLKANCGGTILGNCKSGGCYGLQTATTEAAQWLCRRVQVTLGSFLSLAGKLLPSPNMEVRVYCVLNEAHLVLYDHILQDVQKK